MEMVHFIPPKHRRLTLLAAQADSAPVLIYGASGTGKGAIAKWIHQNSSRTAKRFAQATRDEALSGQIADAQAPSSSAGSSRSRTSASTAAGEKRSSASRARSS